MPFDPTLLKLEHQKLWEKQCLAFCSVLRESNLISADLSLLLTKKDPPAAQSTIAAVTAARNSIKALYLPMESAKIICEFAFGFSRDNVLMHCVARQRRHYSRLPGKIVLRERARIRERVRESYCLYSGEVGRVGTIISLHCDSGTEIAVRWDDGSVNGNLRGGLKCGKKGRYDLVYA